MDDFIEVVNSRKTRSRIRYLEPFKNIPDILVNIFNIYEIFVHIFSYTDLTDKLIFRSVSIQCKRWVDFRLSDQPFYDDLDEQIIYRSNTISKSSRLYNILNPDEQIIYRLNTIPKLSNLYDILNPIRLLDEKTIKKLIKHESVIILKKYINPDRLFYLDSGGVYSTDKCKIMYVVFYLINNQNVSPNIYKNKIYKLVMNRSTCINKTSCGSCTKIIYLCLENDLAIWDNFFDGFTTDEIFRMMIIAIAHGSFNIFIIMYNRLNVTLLQKNIISILACYDKQYYYFCLRKRKHDNLKLYQESHNNQNINFERYVRGYKKSLDGYDYIIKYLATGDPCTETEIDICISKILNNFDQKFINNIVYCMVDDDDMYEAIYFSKYIVEVSDKIINILIMKKQIGKLDTEHEICSNYSDKINELLEILVGIKYGADEVTILPAAPDLSAPVTLPVLPLLTNLKIKMLIDNYKYIIQDHNTISNDDEQLTIFKKYYLSLYLYKK